MKDIRHKFAGLVPEMLIRRIREHRCVLFAGAGLSAQARAEDGAHLPTWKRLLESMIEWCVDHRVQLRAEPRDFSVVLEKGRLLVVAQELQQSLGEQLNSCLSDVLHSGNTKPSTAHRLLCRTDWVAILTSNYDGLIEGAYALESGGIVPPVFSPDGINHALDCLRNDRFFVFKVHGDVNLPGSIVLSNRDYSRVLYLSPAYRSLLETIFASYTVLFVGFGGSDPDLDGVIDRLSTIYERSIGQHFILISEDEFSALERRRLLEDKRLDCITYQRDASHSQVVEFLRALAQRSSGEVEEAVPFVGDEKRPRAFVSGSHRQLDLLRQVGDVAKHVGFDVWFAESQIAVGDRIVDVISKAIDEADCLIAVMSADAAESSWVQFELGRAWGARKKILPIRIGDARVPSDLMGVMYLQLEGPELSPEDDARLKESLKRLFETTKDS
ncbi:MAG: TIR domain-containing protein [Candidatus Aminicenantes bacterium]|nr:TIR domain-containing protein [Candidatus Aminicenantes bacterium]NIM82337.1 TIR domain-containing protein [Candidatus Aminicenantes bacterium]NIN21720.1 TIR domain-containing protein [Candidatus Aminicenantes bacterium]NIN45529.1 TIR domain-containing protein [Candidatus Aminicenantes bacterium]NIN88360.1 TIR domain-containing protein [Candidatus Aminicenantes bacterium]